MKKLLTLSVLVLGTMGTLNAATVVTTVTDGKVVGQVVIDDKGMAADAAFTKSTLEAMHSKDGKKATMGLFGLKFPAIGGGGLSIF